MPGFGRQFSRRGLLLSGVAAAQLHAQPKQSFPSDAKRYDDPTTDLQVYRLTDPAYSSTLPAYFNRGIARNSGWMIFGCDRGGTPQAYRMDLKTGETRQLTEADDLDRSSLTLTPDNRSFCFFAGRTLFLSPVGGRAKEIYKVPDDWERCPGLTVGPDGTHATFAERQGERSRLRMVALVQGLARTVVEAPFVISDPLPALCGRRFYSARRIARSGW